MPVKLRPTTEQVDRVITEARRLERQLGCDTLSLRYRIAAYCGLRQGEQLALRVADIDLVNDFVSVNGSWYQAPRPPAVDGERPPVPPGFRKSTKTGTIRDLPFRGSLHAELRAIVALRLGLPADVSDADLLAAQLAASDPRELERCPRYLFVDEETGGPWSRGTVRHMWLTVRNATRVDSSDPTGWPEGVPFKNLRHHAATWLKDKTNEDWEVVSGWLGNSMRTFAALCAANRPGERPRCREVA